MGIIVFGRFLTKQAVRNLIINLPDMQTQRKIINVVCSIDDKIELNRKMSQTLEEIAQALFKSWFVDFDPVHAKAEYSTDDTLEAAAKELGISKEVLELFPSEFMESEMGMIPLGWEWKTLEDEFNITMGQSPSGKSYNENQEGMVFFKEEEILVNIIQRQEYIRQNLKD